jgi:hypothetical protein
MMNRQIRQRCGSHTDNLSGGQLLAWCGKQLAKPFPALSLDRLQPLRYPRQLVDARRVSTHGEASLEEAYTTTWTSSLGRQYESMGLTASRTRFLVATYLKCRNEALPPHKLKPGEASGHSAKRTTARWTDRRLSEGEIAPPKLLRASEASNGSLEPSAAPAKGKTPQRSFQRVREGYDASAKGTRLSEGSNKALEASNASRDGYGASPYGSKTRVSLRVRRGLFRPARLAACGLSSVGLAGSAGTSNRNLCGVTPLYRIIRGLHDTYYRVDADTLVV